MSPVEGCYLDQKMQFWKRFKCLGNLKRELREVAEKFFKVALHIHD